MTDIQTVRAGNLIGFQPNTETGRAWLREEVQTERWMLTSSIVWVDGRQAHAIIEAAVVDGLIIH